MRPARPARQSLPQATPDNAAAAPSNAADTADALASALALTEPANQQAPGSRFLIGDLCTQLEEYLDAEDIRQVYQTYLFAAQAHIDQTRLSGEPYIYHPIAVASILADMHMDHQTLMAAILHDVIEDTATAKEEIATRFGAEVAHLVDGVSKLDHVDFRSRQDAQNASLQKMLLAMAHDLRVILIKLADRLHNMRTLGIMKPEKRRRISRETLDIYAPIAYRLGMNDVRLELEELGFRHLYPHRFHVLEKEVARVRGHRKQVVEKTLNAFRRRLQQEGIEAGVNGREKHLYSIYKKMHSKRLPFKDVLDVYGFRILTHSADDCYRVLGIVHSLYRPVPGRFKDYIAIPRSNGYQSLHTVLLGPFGLRIEVQIRTQEMQLLADDGIAAHWHYKAGDDSGGSANSRAQEWLQSVLQMQREAGNSEEFLENVKIDLFPDETFTFTPAGDIIKLPRGATVLDFAYAVHTDIGHQCIGARIDQRSVTMRFPLKTGQTVEVLTSTNARPTAQWLDFVRTGKARSAIRHHLKNLREDEASELGQRILALQLSQLGQKWSDIKPRQIKQTLKRLGYKKLEDLTADIGLGKRIAALVARHFLPRDKAGAPAQDKKAQLSISGTEGMLVSYPRCCQPIPGDPIVGAFRAGRGLVVHRVGCRNLANESHNPEELIDLDWAAEQNQEFVTELRIDMGNQLGVLAQIASAISEGNSNIENVATEERDGVTSSLLIALRVRDRNHLAQVIRRVRSVGQVLRVWRVSDGNVLR